MNNRQQFLTNVGWHLYKLREELKEQQGHFKHGLEKEIHGCRCTDMSVNVESGLRSSVGCNGETCLCSARIAQRKRKT